MRKYLIFILILIFSSCSSQHDKFRYQKVPNKYVLKANDAKKTPTLPSGEAFFPLENALPQNYSTKGDVDYTLYIQKVLDEHKYIKFPNFPLLINSKGLDLRSNSILYFQEKSAIIMASDKRKPDYFKNVSIKDQYDILKLYDIENVKVYNATIIGERDTHLGTEGEWGAGIAIKDSKNITIENANVKNTWGDGIFIGSEKNKVSENIFVNNATIDYARRNGISITSALNVYINKVLISNTQGTLPMSGIDIEPSAYLDRLDNIQLSNIITYNNANAGIVINLNLLSNDLNKKDNLTISIDNHTDEGSNYAFGYSIDVEAKKNNPEGIILYKNATWLNQRAEPYWKTTNKKKMNVKLKNVKVVAKGNGRISYVNNDNF